MNRASLLEKVAKMTVMLDF